MTLGFAGDHCRVEASLSGVHGCGPGKTELSLAQLDALSRLDVGKIANGLFLLKDELSLLDRAAHMDALVRAGVELFQIEVESLLDPEVRIGPKVRARIGSSSLVIPR